MELVDSMLKLWAPNGWKQHLISEMQAREGEHAKWGDGESTYTAFRYVVRVMHDVSGQAEVADLHDFPLCQEDITSGQVPVDTLHRKRRNGVGVNPSAPKQHRPCKTGRFRVAHRAAWCTSERLFWHKELTSRLPSQPLPRARKLWRKADTW